MADADLRKLRIYKKENCGGSFISMPSLSSAVDVGIEKSGGGDAWRKAGEGKSNVEKTGEMLTNVNQRKKNDDELQKSNKEILNSSDLKRQDPYYKKFHLQSPRIRDRRLQAHLFIKLILQERKKIDKQFDIQPYSAVKTTMESDDDDDHGVSLYGMVRAG